MPRAPAWNDAGHLLDDTSATSRTTQRRPNLSTVRGFPTSELAMESSTDFFQQLPAFEDATERFDDMPAEHRRFVLDRCGEVIMKHGLENLVGIDLKHRHFDLDEGTVLVETQVHEDHRSVMKPISRASLEMGATPFSFMLDQGTWTPYEFVVQSPEAIAGLTAVLAKPGFLSELKDVLVKYGVEKMLGFHVLHRDFLEYKAEGTVETPGDGPKELLIRQLTSDLRAELAGFDSHEVMWTWAISTGSIICVACLCAIHPKICINHPKQQCIVHFCRKHRKEEE